MTNTLGFNCLFFIHNFWDFYSTPNSPNLKKTEEEKVKHLLHFGNAFGFILIEWKQSWEQNWKHFFHFQSQLEDNLWTEQSSDNAVNWSRSSMASNVTQWDVCADKMWKHASAASVINQHCLLISSFSPEVGIRKTLTLLHLTLQSTVKGHGGAKLDKPAASGAQPLGSTVVQERLKLRCRTPYMAMSHTTPTAGRLCFSCLVFVTGSYSWTMQWGERKRQQRLSAVVSSLSLTRMTLRFHDSENRSKSKYHHKNSLRKQINFKNLARRFWCEVKKHKKTFIKRLIAKVSWKYFIPITSQ